jgi:HEAT repeat protein
VYIYIVPLEKFVSGGPLLIHMQVRSAAVMALAKLGLSSEKVAHGALELIVDMINDNSSFVRQKTITALASLADAGRLSVLETHLHMVRRSSGKLGQLEKGLNV